MAKAKKSSKVKKTNLIPSEESLVDLEKLEDESSSDEINDGEDFVDVIESSVMELVPSALLRISGTGPSAHITNEYVGFGTIVQAISEDFQKDVDSGRLPQKGRIPQDKMKVFLQPKKIGEHRTRIHPRTYKVNGVEIPYWEVPKRNFAVAVFNDLETPEGTKAILKINPNFKACGIICPGEEILLEPIRGQLIRSFYCPNGALVACDVPWMYIIFE